MLYFVFLDESGDTNPESWQGKYYILCSLIVPDNEFARLRIIASLILRYLLDMGIRNIDEIKGADIRKKIFKLANTKGYDEKWAEDKFYHIYDSIIAKYLTNSKVIVVAIDKPRLFREYVIGRAFDEVYSSINNAFFNLRKIGYFMFLNDNNIDGRIRDRFMKNFDEDVKKLFNVLVRITATAEVLYRVQKYLENIDDHATLYFDKDSSTIKDSLYRMSSERFIHDNGIPVVRRHGELKTLDKIHGFFLLDSKLNKHIQIVDMFVYAARLYLLHGKETYLNFLKPYFVTKPGTNEIYGYGLKIIPS